MAGANYMGGKRNAARARGKDATAKVQRIHFGKRKLDILAKGSAIRARCPASPPCTAEDPPVTPDNLFRKDAGSGPLSASSTTTRSSANRTRSSRILSALDTSEPLFMRAEMDRLRSLPNLAGLSQKNLTAPRHTEESDENNRSPDPAVDTREYSSSLLAESLERDEFAADYYPQPGSTSHRSTVQIRPPDTLLLHADYISQISFQQISHAETDFEPMPLDSSPPWHDDSGYAEFANDLTYSGDSNACSSAPAYEPTRYSFYDHSDSPVVSHREESFSSPSMWSSSRSMRSLHPAFADGSALELRGSDFGSRSTSMSPRSTFWSISSPSRLEGPRLAFARQLSHNFDEPHTPPAVQSLLDAMHGELFEGSDPWTALDRILGLENTVGYPDLSFGNLPESLAEGDRSGVGYHKSKANGSLRTAAAGVEAVEGCCLRETSRQKALGSSDASRSSSAVLERESLRRLVHRRRRQAPRTASQELPRKNKMEPDSGSSEPLLPRYTTTASGASAESEIRDGVSPERPPENSTEGLVQMRPVYYAH
ncbi:hypothetical protein B0H21DRAFT_712309 [Amylocystis lapponica]|nr:hypothetical protein B0H21DRAFT_712309 [Amylocystis lapponica]